MEWGTLTSLLRNPLTEQDLLEDNPRGQKEKTNACDQLTNNRVSLMSAATLCAERVRLDLRAILSPPTLAALFHQTLPTNGLTRKIRSQRFRGISRTPG